MPCAFGVVCMGALHGAQEPPQSVLDNCTEALNIYQSNDDNYYQLQRACTLLIDAWYADHTQTMQPSIEKLLSVLYERYKESVQSHVPYWADVPRECDEHMYDRLASYGDPRANRLKGMLLLMKNDNSGMNYLYQAEKLNDPLAPAVVAKCCAYGMYGCRADKELAKAWLERGVSLGGVNAYELMSEVMWDGRLAFNVPRNYKEAASYLEKVVNEYGRWTMNVRKDEDDRKLEYELYSGMLQVLRSWSDGAAHIQRDGGFVKFDPDWKQIYYAQIDPTSLRYFIKEINDVLSSNAEKYKIPPAASVNVSLIEVVKGTAASDPLTLAMTWRRQDASTVQNKIEFYYDKLPAVNNTTQSFWWRRMVFMDALAHELAHVYFSQRYVAIAEVSSLDNKMHYEGHATNVAYEYTNQVFFNNQLTPEEYASMFLSDEYKQYFFWFRQERLSPGKAVYWNTLDESERRASGNKRVVTRAQTAWVGK